jgi:hypothetical protein
MFSSFFSISVDLKKSTHKKIKLRKPVKPILFLIRNHKRKRATQPAIARIIVKCITSSFK